MSDKTTQPLSWTVEFYRDAKGQAPVEEWMNSLHDPKGIVRARIAATLIRLRDNGGRLPEPYAKHLGGKLWELRWHIGSDQLRVLYSTVTGKIVLLLSGFSKKTPKTPPGEIDLAERRLKDWTERHGRKSR